MWRGQLSTRRALVLVEQLATVPGSRFRALTLGGLDHLNWSRDSGILSDIHDALVDNSVITAKVAGGKPSMPEKYPRPIRKEDREPEPEVFTIDTFPIHMIQAMTSRK